MKKNYSKWIRTAIVLSICMVFGFMTTTGFAQDNTPYFIEIDLMKVNPGDEGNYVDVEQTLWKPLHKERINQGTIVGWILYEVMYTGADDAYNYATVNVYTNSNNLENPYQGIEFEKIHPGKNMNEEIEKTLNSRKLIRKQLMSRTNFAYPEGSMAPGPHKYLVVNYMKTLPGGNFMQFENELAKPVSQELIKNGNWAGWTLWANVFPSGSSLESDVVTVDYYENFSKLVSVDYFQAFEKAHPGKAWSEFIENAEKSRTMVRSELWRVIDFEFAGQ